MGEAGEGQMITHQQKKMGLEALRKFRDRFSIPLSDAKIEEIPFLKLDEKERKYLEETRRALGGSLPQRRAKSASLDVPELSSLRCSARQHRRAAKYQPRWPSFVYSIRCYATKTSASSWCRSFPTRSRTFGMEGMFRQFRIFSQVGQLYKPQDADQLMYYREDRSGQMLQEGINEAGAMSSWIAAATSYSTSNVPMIPFYIYYSMFGLQRVGDLAWAAGDMRARGFLLGGTAGRTTLNGEGPTA